MYVSVFFSFLDQFCTLELRCIGSSPFHWMCKSCNLELVCVYIATGWGRKTNYGLKLQFCCAKLPLAYHMVDSWSDSLVLCDHPECSVECSFLNQREGPDWLLIMVIEKVDRPDWLTVCAGKALHYYWDYGVVNQNTPAQTVVPSSQPIISSSFWYSHFPCLFLHFSSTLHMNLALRKKNMMQQPMPVESYCQLYQLM